jgi:hypothetical protein
MTGRRALRARLARALFLEVARGIQTFRAVGNAAVVSRMTVSAAALAKHRIARLLVTLKQVGIGVPALALVAVAPPGAKLISLRASTPIARLTIAPRRLTALVTMTSGV